MLDICALLRRRLSALLLTPKSPFVLLWLCLGGGSKLELFCINDVTKPVEHRHRLVLVGVEWSLSHYRSRPCRRNHNGYCTHVEMDTLRIFWYPLIA